MAKAKAAGQEGVQDINLGRDPGVTAPDSVFAGAEGYQVAQAIERFGARGETLAIELLKDRADKEDSMFATTALTRYQTEARDLLRKMQQEDSEKGVGFTDRAKVQLKSLAASVRQRTLAELPASKRAVQHFDERVLTADVSHIEHAAVYEDRARKSAYYDKATENLDRIGLGVSKGTLSRDDALSEFGRILGDARSFLSPEEARKFEDAGKRHIARAYYLNLADRAPGQVLAMLKQRSAEQLSADGLKTEDWRQIQHAADAAIRRGQSAAALRSSETNEHMRTYIQFRERGIPVPPEFETKIQGLIGSGDPKKKTEAQRRFDSIRTFYDTVDANRGKSIPELRGAVESMRLSGERETLQASIAVEKLLRERVSTETQEYKRLLDELKPLAMAGRPLPEEKITRMIQIGRDVDAESMAKENGGEASQLASYALRLQGMGGRIGEARTLPATGVAAMLRRSRALPGEAEPADDAFGLAEEQAIATALQGKIKERDADPRAYVDKYYPEVGQGMRAEDPVMRAAAVQRLLELQRAEGVSSNALSIMSKPEALEAETRIKSTTGVERANTIRTLVNQYGAENWDIVQGQLDRGENLPPDARVIASLPWGQGKDEALYVVSANLAKAFQMKPTDWKDVGIEKTDLSSLETAAVKSIGEFTASMRDPKRAAHWSQAVQQLAAYYKGMDKLTDDAAITRAKNELIFDHYNFAFSVRVPKMLNGSPVPMAGVRALMDYGIQAETLKTLPIEPAQYEPRKRWAMTADQAKMWGFDEAFLSKMKEGLITREEAQKQFITALNSRGFWRTKSDGTGMIFMTPAGVPLELKQDMPEYDAFGRLKNPRFYEIPFTRPTDVAFWDWMRRERRSPGRILYEQMPWAEDATQRRKEIEAWRAPGTPAGMEP